MTTTRARDTRPAAPVSQQQLKKPNPNTQSLNHRPALNHPHRAALKRSTRPANPQNFTPNAVQTDRTNAARLFQALHQGGAYAHLWTDAGNQSFWFTTASPNCARLKPQTERVLYRQWVRHNVFFSVHPLGRMPPHNSSGNGNPRYISSQLPYIVAINALFAEYDGKDHVRLPEYMAHLPTNYVRLNDIDQRKAVRSAQEKTFYANPERYKLRVFKKIEALFLQPSIIIDSGGGYHCYWLFDETHPVDDSNRVDVQSTQHGWVRMVGADIGASDLRRVLRVPGTTNRKAGFGANPPRVTFVKAEFEQRYRYTELEEMTNDWLYEHEPSWASHMGLTHRRDGIAEANYQSVPLGLPVEEEHQRENGPLSRITSDEESVRRRFNRQHSLVDLLVKHGYQISFANDSMTRLSRPGRPKQNSSVIVFPGRDDNIPELSIHFSTNDELYSEEYVHPRSKQIKRRAYDTYSLFAFLEHGGNWQRAYRAALRHLESGYRSNQEIASYSH